MEGNREMSDGKDKEERIPYGKWRRIQFLLCGNCGAVATVQKIDGASGTNKEGHLIGGDWTELACDKCAGAQLLQEELNIVEIEADR